LEVAGVGKNISPAMSRSKILVHPALSQSATEIALPSPSYGLKKIPLMIGKET
jgi:hypothetical protein